MQEILNNITEWYQINLGDKTVFVKIGLFFFAFLGLFLLLRSSQTKQKLETLKAKRKAEKSNTMKGGHNRFVQDKLGTAKPFMIMDEIYKYSRIYATSKIKTSIGYFRITAILATAIAVVTVGVVGLDVSGIGYGIFAFVMIWIIMYGYLELLRLKNNREISNEMYLFVNMLSNYSTGNTEIMATFMAIQGHMKKCLRGCLIECVAQCQDKGTVEALENLGRKIENKKFREVLKSLIIAQKYSGGFTDAVNQLRRDINEHLTSAKQVKSLVMTNMASMLVCFGGILLMIGVMGSILEENSFLVLLTTMIGRICAGVMLFGILWFTKRMLEVEA